MSEADAVLAYEDAKAAGTGHAARCVQAVVRYALSDGEQCPTTLSGEGFKLHWLLLLIETGLLPALAPETLRE